MMRVFNEQLLFCQLIKRAVNLPHTASRSCWLSQNNLISLGFSEEFNHPVKV